MSVDDVPVLGRLPGWENAYVCTGHGANGLLLGPYSAHLVAGARRRAARRRWTSRRSRAERFGRRAGLSAARRVASAACSPTSSPTPESPSASSCGRASGSWRSTAGRSSGAPPRSPRARPTRAGASLYTVVQPDDFRWHLPSHLVDPEGSPSARRVPRPRRRRRVDPRLRPRRLLDPAAARRRRPRARGADRRRCCAAELDGYEIVDDIDEIPRDAARPAPREPGEPQPRRRACSSSSRRASAASARTGAPSTSTRSSPRSPPCPRDRRGGATTPTGRSRPGGGSSSATRRRRGRLRLDALARYLQDLATNDARRRGRSTDGRGWILRRMELDVHRLPRSTRTSSSRRGARASAGRWAERSTTIADTRALDGGICAVARAVWVYVDLDTGAPVALPPIVLRGLRRGGPRAQGERPAHAPAPPPDATRRPWPLRSRTSTSSGTSTTRSTGRRWRTSSAGRLDGRRIGALRDRVPAPGSTRATMPELAVDAGDGDDADRSGSWSATRSGRPVHVSRPAAIADAAAVGSRAMSKQLKLGFMIGYWGAGPPVERAGAHRRGRAPRVRLARGPPRPTASTRSRRWPGGARRRRRIQLGTSIIQMSARTPTAMAMAAITMDHLTNGRFILGLGASGPQVVEGWYGQPYPKPLARTREYVEIIRKMLARESRSPTPASTTRCRTPVAPGSGRPVKSITHPLRKDLPIYLAAEGPKNVALSGGDRRRLARDLLLTEGRRLLPRRAGRGVRPARRACATADDFEVAATVPVIIHDDVEEAAGFLRPVLALYIGGMGAREVNFHANVFGRMGYEAEAREIQDLYLAGQEGRGRRAGADVADRGDRAHRSEGEDPRRPRGVARVAASPRCSSTATPTPSAPWPSSASSSARRRR